MPGFVVFGRRWAVGSDDFVFPAAAEIFLRIFWFLALAIVLAVHNDDLSICQNGHLLKIYYVAMLIILPLAILLSSTIMYFSMQGTILNAEPRKHVSSLVIFKLCLFVMEIAWTGVGTYWAFSGHVDHCSAAVVGVVKGATVVGWILLLLLLIGIVVVFDPLGRQRSQGSETQAQLQKLWRLRCKLLCCCCCVRGNINNESNAFDDVARIITEHLLGLNFVVTDVAAAMILVQQKQELQQQQQIRAGGSDISRIPYCTGPSVHGTLQGTEFHPKPWMTMSAAAAFMKFAVCSYGWPFFVYDNQCTGPFKLFFRCKCCYCLRISDNIYGDNCCGWNTAAILEQTRIMREDIFYVTYHNKLYEIPFYIVFDHEHKSVVVSIRGTLSFEDALTDLSADAEDVSVEGVAEAKAHRGILQAARYIERTLSHDNLLENAFLRAPDYDLVIVGHSLGAGAAAILAILLKPQHPNLRCFAYSPPGGLLSLPLSRYAEGFVCSVVVGKDLVPRLGIVTIDKLKREMIATVRASNKPKYLILGGSAWQKLFGRSGYDVTGAEMMSNEPLISGSARTQSYTEEQEPIEERTPPEVISLDPVSYYPLFMPGLVLFLEETQPGRGCFGIPTYDAFWMRPESFDEILVSGMAMLHDHMPNVVYRALNSLSEGDAGVEVTNRANLVV